jgi:hypothetical protein
MRAEHAGSAAGGIDEVMNPIFGNLANLFL